MSAYYNEFEPFAAAWLRNLIAAGLIPAGDVDTRSIADVQPDDLVGYRQCHFFAGIGGWALAARLAGWPDDRELWTGSCPCQPFSVAGKGSGTNDDRHLWPHQLRLLRARRPAVWMGEQVAAAVGKGWLDGVLSDLESIGYAGRAAVVPACAVDGPHRRDRLWIVADGSFAEGDSERPRLERLAGHGSDAAGWAQPGGSVAEAGCGGAVAAGDHGRRKTVGQHGALAAAEGRKSGAGHQSAHESVSLCGDGDVADRAGDGREQGITAAEASRHGRVAAAESGTGDGRSAWAGAGWIIGHDGKARRVEPSIRLLAHGVPARVERLRAYGNAIVPQVAAEVIAAYMDVRGAA